MTFADGSHIPDTFIQALGEFMSKHASVYRWEAGNFVIVDNSVTYHSRQPFSGKRTVYAAIADGTKQIDLLQTSLTLNSGDRMPSVGLGLWKIPNE